MTLNEPEAAVELELSDWPESTRSRHSDVAGIESGHVSFLPKGILSMGYKQAGGCQCLFVRYEVTEAPRLVYTCHCTDCQRITGSAFSLGMVVGIDEFKLAQGELSPLLRTASNGQVRKRWVCPDCGTWICNGNAHPASPSEEVIRVVRPGTLDDTSWLRPTVHFWTRSAQSWFVLPINDLCFETQPNNVYAFFASGGKEV